MRFDDDNNDSKDKKDTSEPEKPVENNDVTDSPAEDSKVEPEAEPQTKATVEEKTEEQPAADTPASVPEDKIDESPTPAPDVIGSTVAPTPATAPAPAPEAEAAPAPAAQAQTHTPVNAGLVILQWLTYAFWGWTVLGLSILTAMVFANFINGADTGDFTPYGIAAVLVLLPISYVCDVFYSKREPAHKTGPETLVMVVHAVIFALFGIGTLIGAVFSMVMMLVGTDSEGTLTALLTCLVVSVYYGLTFLRTLNPARFGWIKKWYKLVMLISIGVIALLGIIGPVAHARSVRDDKLIVSGLPSISQAINDYASKEKKLPADLSTLELDGDSKQLVGRSLVQYKPEATSTTIEPATTGTTGATVTKPGAKAVIYPSVSTTQDYRYQLCVTFKEKTRYNSYSSPYDGADSDGYMTYLSVYDHPAGEKCYKLKATSYNAL